jgi:hypothetical protein
MFPKIYGGLDLANVHSTSNIKIARRSHCIDPNQNRHVCVKKGSIRHVIFSHSVNGKSVGLGDSMR